jgi:hypothetical protein
VRNGGDRRGSSYSRRARKHWLLATFGDGHTCECVWCGDELTFETVEQDRKDPNGPYRRENLQPACRFCNASRGNGDSPRTLRTVVLVAA